MEEVSLIEMLEARENRSHLQHRLLEEYPGTLVCLTLNIPGPIKILPGVPDAYAEGCRRITNALFNCRIQIIHKEEILKKTGYEAFFSTDGDIRIIKSQMILLEDQDRLGRLFDIDVLHSDGSRLSREDLGFPGRTCLLCDNPAKMCSRSRRHSIPELTAEIRNILQNMEKPC